MRHRSRLHHGERFANAAKGDLLYRLTTNTFAIQALTMNGVFPVLTSLVLLVVWHGTSSLA
jgi:hypothetical protein